MTTNRVLVTGGTGRLGRALLPRLLDAGHRVRVLTRQERGQATHDWAVDDLHTAAGLPREAAGTDVIIHLATTNGRSDLPRTGGLIEAARAADAPHLVYVSIVGIDNAALGYHRAKLACERLVERSGLPWTILRTTQFHDLITSMCDVQCMLPVTVMPAGVAGQPAAHRVTDLGGPQVRDAAELARDYLRAISRRRPVWSIPLPGKAIRDYRAGIHLAPDRATERITFDDFLARGQAHRCAP